MKPELEVEASPQKAVLQELEAFRSLVHASLEGFRLKMDAELDAIRSRIETFDPADKSASGKMRDFRDMLTLLRHVDVKPGKGRRKDLKKLDSVIGDLELLVENW